MDALSRMWNRGIKRDIRRMNGKSVMKKRIKITKMKVDCHV